MVSIRGVAWVLAAAVTLAAYRPALADPITMTGNVASDFTTSNGSTMVPVDIGPGDIAGPTGSTANQLVSGVDIQNIWLNYNATTDTMSVGIQGYKNVAGQEEIFGDASGNPNPAARPESQFRRDSSRSPSPSPPSPRTPPVRTCQARRRSSPASLKTRRWGAAARSTASPSRSTAPMARGSRSASASSCPTRGTWLSIPRRRNPTWNSPSTISARSLA